MLYILKIADYLKILTDEEVKDFVVINFGDCLKCTREKLYFKLQCSKRFNFYFPEVFCLYRKFFYFRRKPEQ